MCAGKETTRTSEAAEATEPLEKDKWREVLVLLLEEQIQGAEEPEGRWFGPFFLLHINGFIGL